jgi:hypothetical protein
VRTSRDAFAAVLTPLLERGLRPPRGDASVILVVTDLSERDSDKDKGAPKQPTATSVLVTAKASLATASRSYASSIAELRQRVRLTCS